MCLARGQGRRLLRSLSGEGLAPTLSAQTPGTALTTRCPTAPLVTSPIPVESQAAVDGRGGERKTAARRASHARAAAPRPQRLTCSRPSGHVSRASPRRARVSISRGSWHHLVLMEHGGRRRERRRAAATRQREQSGGASSGERLRSAAGARATVEMTMAGARRQAPATAVAARMQLACGRGRPRLIPDLSRSRLADACGTRPRTRRTISSSWD